MSRVQGLGFRVGFGVASVLCLRRVRRVTVYGIVWGTL